MQGVENDQDLIEAARKMLGPTTTGTDSVIQMIARNVIAITFRLDDNLLPVKKLLAKYCSVPMSLADAWFRSSCRNMAIF